MPQQPTGQISTKTSKRKHIDMENTDLQTKYTVRFSKDIGYNQKFGSANSRHRETKLRKISETRQSPGYVFCSDPKGLEKQSPKIKNGPVAKIPSQM